MEQAAPWIAITADLATPLVVAVLGVLLLRRAERIRTDIAAKSAFRTKWAEQFFACSQQFLEAIERELSILNLLMTAPNANDSLAASLRQEIGGLRVRISELELRLRRAVVFAEISGRAVTDAARDCVALVGRWAANRQGSFDEIVAKMNEFSTAARKAHAEILERDAK